ncbi:MAG: dehydrogenase [Rhodopirellula sp.]|nr:dehydrogenase [Rhodopirellula sp.]
MERRDFLKATAATTAAATTSNAIAQDSPNEKIVIGVMGLSRGRSLAVRFAERPNVEIKYVCDVDSERAESAAKLVQGAVDKTPEAITDFRQILDDKSVDALVCAAPNHWHAPATILACKAGKHVYVEKPCSHNPWEGEMMVKAARKYKRAVQMGSQRRSSVSMQEAVQLIKDGAIGEVHHARTHYFSARGSIGTGEQAEVPPHINYEDWQGPAPRVPFVNNYLHYNWHWFWHWGNGELGNNGVHSLDAARMGLGVDFPVQVSSSGGRYFFDDDQQTPDTSTVTYRFADDKFVTWQGLSCNRNGSGFVDFYGRDGCIKVDGNSNWKMYDRSNKEVKSGTGNNGDIEHIENFLDAIRSDTPLALNAEIQIGHTSTMLCHLGNIAQRTGRTLSINPKNGHIVGDDAAMKYWQRDYADGWVEDLTIT